MIYATFQTGMSKLEKHELEKSAMQTLLSHVEPVLSIEIMQLWMEYEQNETYEAKVVKVKKIMLIHVFNLIYLGFG